MEINNNYYCNSCNKQYKSYKTLWFHNKTKHKIINDTDIIDENFITPKSLQITQNNSNNLNSTSIAPQFNSKTRNFKLHDKLEIDNSSNNNIQLNCMYCNKIFNRIDNLHRHENNSCKKKEQVIKEKKELKELKEIEELKEKEKLKEKFDTINSELIELKKILLVQMNKNCKTHPKTLEKINNALVNSNNTLKNKNNNNNNNNNNNTNTLTNNSGTINNYNIIALGKEDLVNVLNKNQQIDILNKQYKCLENMIQYIHFNDKFPQFKNILITNIMNNIGYIYDEKEKKFIATTKDNLLDTLIIHRMCDIEEFYQTNINKLDKQTQKTIEKFIDKMEDSKTFSKNRKKAIKLIIYNNIDKVTKELVSNLEIYI